jgi:hypothetical protein
LLVRSYTPHYFRRNFGGGMDGIVISSLARTSASGFGEQLFGYPGGTNKSAF